MAKCGVTNIGGGGGIGSDEVSAGKENVLNGKTYVGADTGDEIGTGTMANNGATGNQSLNAGSSFLVKKGYHAQDFSVGANSLASQTTATASTGHLLSGQTAWVNGSKLTGNIPYQNADISGTDRAWATNISCWEGVACLGVRNAHYLNGVNWIQGNISNFYAGNIKKGVNMGGLVGTFEGYVPTATDLYLKGNNIAGWIKTFGASLDTGQISITFYNFQITTTLNLTGHNYLNVQGILKPNTTSIKLYLLRGSQILTSITFDNDSSSDFVCSIPISNYAITSEFTLNMYPPETATISKNFYGAIYRIWFS